MFRPLLQKCRYNPICSCRLKWFEDVGKGGCSHQSMNHVSAPQNWDYVTLMDGQQLSYVQAPALQITSILRDSYGVANGTEDRNSPVAAFEQASVSTEIGCYLMNYFSAPPLKKLRITSLLAMSAQPPKASSQNDTIYNRI
ncbi:uncharacterized protein LOC111868403 [Cryptotermes secundus]|uniref:uncharacterized protein LOC111868403 n=1 Tax=Cryptotermes secundus TaxID=105785 RepID=UPI001454E3DD|nr:uncharacterized protein LOC111868403 [Cryptotermes secundus]